MEEENSYVVFNPSNEPEDVIEAKKDFVCLENIIKTSQWDVKPTSKPFDKNVVTVLGTMSAGKSSFVNHFFQVGVKQVALEQMDTHFTIVETVPEDEFAEIVNKSGTYKRINMPDDKITTFIDDYSDEKQGVVYKILLTSETIARHKQFEPLSKVFLENNLIHSILINEHYLRGNENRLNIMKNTILIDSPGFTPETNVAKLRGNLQVLQFMYSLSDLTLFCIDSASIGHVSSQLTMLELSVLYAFHGESQFVKTLDSLVSENKSSGFSFSITELFSATFRRIQKLTTKEEPVYDGASYWDKVKFVITKIDNADRCTCEKAVSAEAQFFELGILVGKNLHFLKPPVFSQCFAIAIPEQQTYKIKQDGSNKSRQIQNKNNDNTIIRGDLDRLIAKIGSLNFYDSYIVRLDAAIQKQCEDLQIVMKKSWSSLYYRSDVSSVNIIYEKSKQRSKQRVKSKHIEVA